MSDKCSHTGPQAAVRPTPDRDISARGESPVKRRADVVDLTHMARHHLCCSRKLSQGWRAAQQILKELRLTASALFGFTAFGKLSSA
jgi:hypothetical protein